MTDIVTTPLTGKALLQKAKELNNLPKREQAKNVVISLGEKMA